MSCCLWTDANENRVRVLYTRQILPHLQNLLKNILIYNIMNRHAYQNNTYTGTVLLYLSHKSHFCRKDYLLQWKAWTRLNLNSSNICLRWAKDKRKLGILFLLALARFLRRPYFIFPANRGAISPFLHPHRVGKMRL